ncbi:cryptochrome/photolyase family protein [Marivivens marinus]|uniref:cryptochrome/photolyase family protein n=1 Tax=Marivivens marinus TaxID=3110173 RepID=UPI003B849F2A
MSSSPIILWFRRDLRLSDHPALHEAAETGRPVIPVFLDDEVTTTLGAAPRFRLGLAVEAFGDALGRHGSHLILRRGRALEALRALIAETGARAVWWTRAYDPDSKARDTEVKAALKAEGIDARSFSGAVLFEPWTVETGQGGYYKVYSPYWRAVKDRDPGLPLPRPARIIAPEVWPASDSLSDWRMDAPMRRGAGIVRRWQSPGEDAAADMLGEFLERRVEGYKARRDFLAEDATSGLSEGLTYGEISPRTIWHAGRRAMEEGAAGAEHFLKELVWREFAWHLAHHCPGLATENWRPEWAGFPWETDEDRPEVVAWEQARTGIPAVDAGLREMYVTGRMHNRARMIVASYLTKHLMADWRIGMRWFADCLTDWDWAANAMGWQWVAGCGPDAAPYFRVFNPVGQQEKFDPDQTYIRRWIAEGQGKPPDAAMAYLDAVPRSWGLRADAAYPSPMVTPDAGRRRALAAYEGWKDSGTSGR